MSYFLGMARSYLDSGQEEKARELAVRARHQKSGDPEILAGWAAVFEDLGIAGRALECYKAAIRAAPENCGIMFKLALLLSETGHEEESAHYLKKILARQPEHP